jgi:RecB family exonuclease
MKEPTAKLWQHWSYTKLLAFINCQRRFFYQYVEKPEVPQLLAMEFGKLMHSQLKMLYEGRYHTAESCANSFRGRFFQLAKQGNIAPSFQAERNRWFAYAAAGKSLLEKSWQARDQELASGRKVLAVEKTIKFTFNGLQLEAKIDRIDQLPNGGLEIIDYKVGYQQHQVLDLKLNFQFTIYQLACQLLYEQPVVSWRLCELCPGAGIKDVSGQPLGESDQQELAVQLAAASQTVKNAIEELRFGPRTRHLFLRRPGQQCKNCLFASVCLPNFGEAAGEKNVANLPIEPCEAVEQLSFGLAVLPSRGLKPRPQCWRGWGRKKHV